MPTATFRIESFDPMTATDALWDGYLDHTLTLFQERNPDDPPPPRDMIQGMMQEPDERSVDRRWLTISEDNQQVLGDVLLNWGTEKKEEYESQKHVLFMNLRVHPDYRRQGIGTTLLKIALEEAQQHPQFTILQTMTSHEAGIAFCESLDGESAISGAENRLQLSDVNWLMIQHWCEEGAERAPDVQLIRYDDLPPDDLLPAYSAMYTEVLNQQPLGEVEGAEAIMSPDRFKDMLDRYRKQDFQYHTVISQEADGTLSGVTDILYSPKDPHRIHQLLTGVQEAYRGRGLGKWLKAHMLTFLRDQYPDAKFITTGNASTNAPMLSINERLGFKVHREDAIYKFQLADLCAKLGLD